MKELKEYRVINS